MTTPEFAAAMGGAEPAYQPLPEVGPQPPVYVPPPPPPPSAAVKLLVPFLIGSAVSVGLGAYGKLHDPTGIAVNIAGFSGPLAAKTCLATVGFLLALVKLSTALAMYGKLPGLAHPPAWFSTVHRWSGRLAFLCVVPVALHCLYAVGFDDYSPRVLIHSLLGCFFFGAFTAKMLLLQRKGLPGWALPVFGGLVFTALAGLWLTSSVWFFTTFGVTF
jgi:hypothetical protein